MTSPWLRSRSTARERAEPFTKWARVAYSDRMRLPTVSLSLLRSGQAVQLRGGVHEVRRREAFRERAVNGGQFVAGLVATTLSLPEPGQAHRGPQFQGLRLLTAGDGDGLTETGFGLRRVLRIKGQQELPL